MGDLLAGEQFARALQKHDQNLKWLGVQFDANSLAAKLACDGIDFKHTEAVAPHRSRLVIGISHAQIVSRGLEGALSSRCF